MGRADSGLDILKGVPRKIVFDVAWDDLVDGLGAEGALTYTDLLPAGWYCAFWSAEALIAFAGPGALDMKLRVGDQWADNNYTSTPVGMSCDSAADLVYGHNRVAVNAPNLRGAAEDIVVTVAVTAGSVDYTDINAGLVRITLHCSVPAGY